MSLADAGITAGMIRAAAAGGLGVLNTLAEHAGGGAVEPSAELAAALDVGAALQRLLRGTRPLTDVPTSARIAPPSPSWPRRRAASNGCTTSATSARWSTPSPASTCTAAPAVDHCRCSSPAPLPGIVTVSIGDLPAAAVDGPAARQLERGDAGHRGHDGCGDPLRRATLAGPAVDPPRLPGQPGRGLVARRRRGHGHRDRRPRPGPHGPPRRGGRARCSPPPTWPTTRPARSSRPTSPPSA